MSDQEKEKFQQNVDLSAELKDFFTTYRHGRYSQYWVRRFGMIPEIATSYDNSNDIYDLLAWLQRAFKMLLDDFQSLELEFEEFKNAIIELLQVLIPQLIRQFIHSEEFITYINKLFWEFVNSPEFNEWLNNYVQNWWDENYGDTWNTIVNNNKDLETIIKHLTEIGVWENGGFKQGMGIAGGNINLFSNTPDGSTWIKTNKNKTENDLYGG